VISIDHTTSDGALLIDTNNPIAELGELGPVHLIQTPQPMQAALGRDLERAQTTTARTAPPTGRLPDPPSGDILVRILGPVTVQTNQPKPRRTVIQLAAYLAAHPQGARRERWATAIWPDTILAPNTIRARMFDLRRTLGGTNTILTDAGVDRLNCGTDWTLYQRHLADDDPHGALQLVRGEPLADLDAEWPYAEDAPAIHIQLAIADLAINHAQQYLDAGDPGEAEWAARQGLLANPNDHRLWVILLKSLTAQGRQAEARRILQRLEATDPDLADDELVAATR
jgi:hypothetical protein